ncbi:type I-E CRISPR-associated protein Cas5/CasD [Streptomyces mauvecolor]|uniref:Type I-E CRISPR-associated protein Cas5/CasD n=1 Tax=Streptomyces mauvecolor TaxID=58345 RepID=A0ABV9UET9_9ACTN
MSTYTLLLRLEGVLQTWGGLSRFNARDSLPRPTKSGVIGLLAAADGHDRDEADGDHGDYLPLATLAELRFGVRADRPGQLIEDFQTAGGGRYPLRPRDVILDPARAQLAATALNEATGPTFTRDAGSSIEGWYGAPKNIAPHPASGELQAGSKDRYPQITRRWYIADGAFLAGVESSDRRLLARLASRLDAPRRLLGLGRRSCAPSHPVNAGIRPGPLEDVLATTPLLPRPAASACAAWFEVPPHTKGSVPQNDQPVSFSSRHRTHQPRWEQRTLLTPPAGAPA